MTLADRDSGADAVGAEHGRNVTLLVQPRPRANSAYIIYGDGLDAPEVHVHVRVLEDLRRAAVDAIPHEAIGALVGRPCRDDYGVFVVVENALTAEPGEYVRAPDATRISDAGRTEIHRRAARQHPVLEPVGWWHSHQRGLPRYNPVGPEDQATCPPYHVEIVVAADLIGALAPPARPPFDLLGVHVGPAATLLEARLPAAAHTPPAAAPARNTEAPAGSVPRSPRSQSADDGLASRTVGHAAWARAPAALRGWRLLVLGVVVVGAIVLLWTLG